MTREAIQQEAEKRFPILHTSENAPKNSRRNQARFIEGAEWAQKKMEAENERLRGLINDLLVKIPMDNGNAYLSGFNESLDKLNNELNNL